MIKSPFKFLDSYTLADRDIFFGRDQEINELYRRVFESKILLVYGVSGTGKSSLVNCGLASRFDDSDWLPVNVRRGSNIIESLDTAINKQAHTLLKTEQTISEKLQSIYLDHFKPIFLIFDQFEELFIFGSQEEKTDFIRLLKAIVDSKVPCRIILVIREEFLAGITEFEYDLSEIFSNRFRVEKMKRANAISAIEGPCRVNNIETKAGFSEELIDKLCPSGIEIELTYLQIYLDRIFRIAEAEKNEDEHLKFSKELLTKAGSVSDLLGQFLEEQIREFDDPETGMAILKSFVSVQGTKRQMDEQEILDAVKAFGIEISELDLIRYLTKFVDLRILRERNDAGYFELRHDALATKIYEKFTAIEKDIIEVRQFIENAYSAYEKREKLLTVDDLKYIAPYEDKLYLSKPSEAFINKSKNEITRVRKRRRNIASIAAIVLIVVLSVFTLWALQERNKAQIQSSIAEQQKNEALKANELAEKAKKDAIIQKTIAIDNEQKAKEAKSLALNAKTIAENELYRNIKNSLTISIEKDKILYLWVENPISVSVTGIPNSRLVVSVSENTKLRGGNGKYKIIPELPHITGKIRNENGTTHDTTITIGNTSSCTITVCAKLQNGTLDTIGVEDFECRPVPDPVASFGDSNGGKIAIKFLMDFVDWPNNNDLEIQQGNYMWKNFEMTGFKMTINHQGKTESQSSVSKSLTKEQKELIKKLNAKDFLIIDSISVIGPDKKMRYLQSLIFQIY